MSTKRKQTRNPWDQLARLVFKEKRVGDPEVKRLQHQIDVGYAKTGKRSRAGTVRDRERAVLVERFGMDRLKGATLGKPFLKECIDVLTDPQYKLTEPPGGWSHNAVRLLIKEIRKPPVVPRPFMEPAPPDDDDADM
jgi:hypothetical protein